MNHVKSALDKNYTGWSIAAFLGVMAFSAGLGFWLGGNPVATRLPPSDPRTYPAPPVNDPLDSLRKVRESLRRAMMVLLMLTMGTVAMAQVRDCCLQAADLQRTLNISKARFNDLYQTDSVMITLLEDRLTTATKTALDQEAELVRLREQNKKYVPRTWAGRQLRYIERGAAIGFGVTIATLILTR